MTTKSAKTVAPRHAATKRAVKRPAATALAPLPAEHPVDTLFFSRDESWLHFNERVLEEAQDPTNPLLERVKFLAITASNLDEFVEIRVAGILQRIEDGISQPQPADEGGLSPQQRLDRLSLLLAHFVQAQYACWNDSVLPALKSERIRVLKFSELDSKARAHALKFYATR